MLALKLWHIWLETGAVWWIITVALHDMNDFHLTDSWLDEIHRLMQL